MGAEAVLSLNDVNGGLGDVTGRMDEMKKTQEEFWAAVFKSIKRNTGGVLEPLGKKIWRISERYFASNC